MGYLYKFFMPGVEGASQNTVAEEAREQAVLLESQVEELGSQKALGEWSLTRELDKWKGRGYVEI